MGVCIEHRVDMIDALTQGLHAKVRSSVDQHPMSSPGDSDGGAGAAIARVSRGADPAGAAQGRHTHRGATAKNRDLCWLYETLPKKL